MSTFEIALARAYLEASEQDPITALIRSVRDLAQTRMLIARLGQPGDAGAQHRRGLDAGAMQLSAPRLEEVG